MKFIDISQLFAWKNVKSIYKRKDKITDSPIENDTILPFRVTQKCVEDRLVFNT